MEQNSAAVEKEKNNTPEVTNKVGFGATLFSSQNYIDLKKEYPMTRRRALKKSFWLLAFFIIALRVVLTLNSAWINTLPEREAALAHLVCNMVLLILFSAWLMRYVFYQIERQNYEYLVSGGNLYFKKGLFVKETGSFPLSRITDIYLHRGWGDYFWGSQVFIFQHLPLRRENLPTFMVLLLPMRKGYRSDLSN